MILPVSRKDFYLRQFSITSLLCAFFLTASYFGGCAVQASELEDLDDFQEDKACSSTASAAFNACKHEVSDDLWIGTGKCLNLADDIERLDCLDINKEKFQEANDLCDDQMEARSEICKILGEDPYDPEINPDNFVDFAAVLKGKEKFVPNPYFPLLVGTVRDYEVVDKAGNKIQRIKVEILRETKEILGVNCIVIRDRVWDLDKNGEKLLVEDTIDWYGQDNQGNVWYFGESVKDYENGELISLAGSFEAGHDLDKAGLIMTNKPIKDHLYRQEFSLGNAEDMGEDQGILGSLTVRGKTYYDVLSVKAFTPIEPKTLEIKYYAPGIGVVLEEKPETGARVELKKINGRTP